MKINWNFKRFNDLKIQELYEILRLRNEIFIVEQNSLYLDMDGRDFKAFHLYAQEEDKIIAYCRLFHSNDYFEEASIGRVLVHPSYRGKKLGHKLIDKAIEHIYKDLKEKNIMISAQFRLKKFYESHDFIQWSSEYLEDNIPHIRMKRSK